MFSPSELRGVGQDAHILMVRTGPLPAASRGVVGEWQKADTGSVFVIKPDRTFEVQKGPNVPAGLGGIMTGGTWSQQGDRLTLRFSDGAVWLMTVSGDRLTGGGTTFQRVRR